LKDKTVEFHKTPGWLDWYAGPSKPRFTLPGGSWKAGLEGPAYQSSQPGVLVNSIRASS
jgi:hypothetical protein